MQLLLNECLPNWTGEETSVISALNYSAKGRMNSKKIFQSSRQKPVTLLEGKRNGREKLLNSDKV